MTPSLQISLSFGLTFGVPAVIALRELLLLRRHRPGEGEPPPDWRWDPDTLGPRDQPRSEDRVERVLEDA